MLIDLYSSSEDPRKAFKAPDLIAGGVSCKPITPFSILSPRIVLNYSSAYNAANYIYLQDYDCFYFAEKILMTAAELELVCKLDPYNSFDLAEVPAMVIRSEEAGINYIPDSKLPIDPHRCWLDGKLFPSQPLQSTLTETDNYLLTVNGGEYL